MKIQEIEIEKLKMYDKNAKKHPQVQIENVAESIKKFGWQQPIVVDKDYIIIIGHCRYLAARSLDLDKVPVVVADKLTDDQVKALRLIDNKTNESDWDFDLLKEELTDLDLTDFQFDWEVPEEEKEAEEDDFDIDAALNENTKVKKGDLFELGNHRLLCGDATSREDLTKLVGGVYVNLLLTDPPYNVAYVGKTKDALTIKNDRQDSSSFLQFLTDAFQNFSEFMPTGTPFYIWCADIETKNFLQSIENAEWKFSQMIIWVKNAFVLGRKDYQYKHEPCLYGWKEGSAHYFIDDRTKTTIIDDNPNIEKMSKEELKALLKEIFSTKVVTDVIYENKPSRNDLHPTMKPLKLLSHLIYNSSKPGDNVVDLFGGSGSTLITCEQMNRNCLTMELDPIYADVIIKRYIEFTGNEVFRINDDGTKTNYKDL